MSRSAVPAAAAKRENLHLLWPLEAFPKRKLLAFGQLGFGAVSARIRYDLEPGVVLVLECRAECEWCPRRDRGLIQKDRNHA
jgi:hypothetical protein